MSRLDPLLDPPHWAPSWLPTVDGGRPVRWLQRGIVAVLVVGVAACVGSGADGPSDPELGPVDVGDIGDPDRVTVCDAPDGDFSTETGTLLQTFGTTTATLTTGDDVVELCVLVASDGAQRARGLMTVTEFDGFDGMVFSYATDSTGPYYMLNTPTPLTIYWWDGDGALVSSTEMEPCLDADAADCPLYPAEAPYRYALEVPLGALDDVVDDSTTIEIAPG